MRIKIDFLKITMFMTFLYLTAYIGYVLQKVSALNVKLNFYLLFSYMGLTITILIVCYFILRFIQKRTIVKLNFSFFVAIIIVFTLTELFSTMININIGWPIFFDIVLWPLLALVSFTFAAKPNFNFDKYRKILYLIGWAFVVMSIPLIIQHWNGNGLSGLVIRPVYFCLSILPLIMLLDTKKSKMKNIFILSCLIVLLASGKRAGVLAGVFGIAGYYLCNLKIINDATVKFKKLIVIFSSAVIVMFILYYFVLPYFQIDILERFESISDDNGSGRTNIWGYVVNQFNNSSFVDKLFGNGYHSVGANLQLPNNEGRQILAHNDFVEVLYDYGYVGFVVLCLLFLMLIATWTKLYKQKSYMLPSYTTFLVVFIIISILSYGVVQSTTINFLAIYMGIVFGRIHYDKNEKSSLKRKKLSSGI